MASGELFRSSPIVIIGSVVCVNVCVYIVPQNFCHSHKENL